MRIGLDHGSCTLLGHAERDHQAAQEFVFQLGVDRARLPAGGRLVVGAVDLFHATVADEDVRAALGIAFEPRPEAVELAGGVERIEHLAERGTDDVLGQLGAVFGPVGFHDAQPLVVGGQHEAVVFPEGAYRVPDLGGRPVDGEPALVAVALDLHVAHGIDGRFRLGLPGGLVLLVGRSRSGFAGDAEVSVAGELGQVGRHFECIAALRGLVVHFSGRGGGARGEREGRT